MLGIPLQTNWFPFKTFVCVCVSAYENGAWSMACVLRQRIVLLCVCVCVCVQVCDYENVLFV